MYGTSSRSQPVTGMMGYDLNISISFKIMTKIINELLIYKKIYID